MAPKNWTGFWGRYTTRWLAKSEHVMLVQYSARQKVAVLSVIRLLNRAVPYQFLYSLFFTSRNPGRDNVERRITTVTAIAHLGIDPELEISPAQEPSREIDRFERHATARQAYPRAERRIRPEQRGIIVRVQKYAEARVPQVLAGIGYRAERNTARPARVQADDYLERRRLFIDSRA